MLYPFQIPGVAPPGPQPKFQRGRLDHYALNAASAEAFRKPYHRLVAEEASDGMVTEMGPGVTFSFVDPDGGAHEVVWMKPSVPITQGLGRANWTTVELASRSA